MKKANIAKQHAKSLGFDTVHYVTTLNKEEVYTYASALAIKNHSKIGTPLFYKIKTNNNIELVSDFDENLKFRRLYLTSPSCKV